MICTVAWGSPPIRVHMFVFFYPRLRDAPALVVGYSGAAFLRNHFRHLTPFTHILCGLFEKFSIDLHSSSFRAFIILVQH
jgi:hypothetical protein